MFSLNVRCENGRRSSPGVSHDTSHDYYVLISVQRQRENSDRTKFRVPITYFIN